MRPRTCHTPGGVEITYRVFDDDEGTTRPTIVMSGGLGGTHLIWSALAKRLRVDFRIVIWDYPGLSTGAPASGAPPITVPDLALYLETILDASDTDRAILAGWSLGPQVSLELFRNRPGAVCALIFICGVAKNPFFDDTSQEPIAAALGLRSGFPDAVTWLTGRIEAIDRLKAMLERLEHPTRWAKRLGFVDPLVDELIFDAVIRDFVGIDPVIYREYIEATAHHDASDLLDSLDIPVLLFSGENDRIITSSRVEDLHRRIPGSEHLEARGATHFLPIEYPDLLALKISDFAARRVGWPPR